MERATRQGSCSAGRRAPARKPLSTPRKACCGWVLSSFSAISTQLAIFAAAAVISAGAYNFAIGGVLTGNAQPNARHRLLAGSWDLGPALGAMAQARSLR